MKTIFELQKLQCATRDVLKLFNSKSMLAGTPKETTSRYCYNHSTRSREITMLAKKCRTNVTASLMLML